MSRTLKKVNRFGNTRKRWAKVKILYRKMERMKKKMLLNKELNAHY